MRILASAVVASALLAYPARGAQPAAPAPAVAGLQAYKADGVDAAVKAWLSGSPLEGGREATTLITSLRGIEDLLGKYESYFVAKTTTFTPTCEVSYIQLIYSKGPLFAKFLVFKTAKGWIVETVRFHTDPWQVWPDDLLSVDAKE